jgi:hypothetical protein
MVSAPSTTSITIQVFQRLLFLHPSSPGEPSEDPLLQGTVTLSLPKSRKVQNIVVKVKATCDIVSLFIVTNALIDGLNASELRQLLTWMWIGIVLTVSTSKAMGD